MNRLIIIGNGFDLAHKMKTSYYDFIFDYIKKCFLKAKQSNSYTDELISISRNDRIQIPNIEEFGEVGDFMAFYLSDADAMSISPKTIEAFEWKIKNKFIEHIFTECHHCGWVDIENEYYLELKAILNIDNVESRRKKIAELNSSFSILKSLLENYLSSLPAARPNAKYNKFFFGKVIKEEIVSSKFIPQDSPVITHVLNFNYTNTIEPYFDGLDSPVTINYIHGELDNKENPIIFGFGDELDTDYYSIQTEKTKGFLHYIKSFWYFKTSNYHNLIRFIDSDEFQIYVFGHSCGLSDRTMLNMIFEHENCSSIKIFYYQNGEKNNYSDLTEEISRHFKDNGIMRKRVVPFDKSSSMPQSE